MRFWLLDTIRSYEPDVTLTAVKNVALTEEYLADHFPSFPCCPACLCWRQRRKPGHGY